jgi:hypothetical protein
MLRRNNWLVVTGGIFALLCLLMAAAAGYWRYANQLPSYSPPAVILPDPNAYDDYVAAGQLCRAVGGATITPAGGGRRIEAYEPDAPLEQVRAVVARNRPALARLREGFRHQYRAPPSVSFAQTYPELADYRSLARALVAEGRLAEREGRPNAAARSYLDCLRLGVDMPRGGVVIHGLVGIAVQELGLDALNRVTDRLDAPTAASMARELARLDRRAPTLAETLAGEKEYITTALLQTFRQSQGPGQVAALFSGGGGAQTGSQVLEGLRYTFTPKQRILDNIRGAMDAQIANARRPYYQQLPPPPTPSDPLSPLILPTLPGLKPAWTRSEAHRRVAQLRLAARAYELQHGAPPPSSKALVPAYLPTVPPDPYAPQPLVYRRVGSRAAVYSRGPDGDDDGGRDLGAKVQPDSDGDVVSVRAAKRR